MSFEHEYKVSSKVGNVVLLTVERLYKEVLEDSKSNYNWSYQATELVRICRKIMYF